MKTTLLILLGCVALLGVVGIPSGWDRDRTGGEAPGEALAGVVLDVGVQRGDPCHLVVTSDAGTVVDRGGVSVLDDLQEFTGTFRYWEEPAGRALYLYDDAQNLVGRVLNPHSVRLLDPME